MMTDPTPAPLSLEREAEIRQRVKAATICPKAQSNGRLNGPHTWSGGSFTHTRCELCGHPRMRGDRAEETADVLAELDRTRAESEKRRVRMAAAEADLMDIRGTLSPNGFPRRVPMELGETIAPVIEWLLDERDELKERVSELGQPTIEARRDAIRGSYLELAAQAREDRDYEGEHAVLRRLERREAEWAAEDAKTSELCPEHCPPTLAERLRIERDELKKQLADLGRALNVTITDRDRAQDEADKLAYAIAPVEVIGERGGASMSFVKRGVGFWVRRRCRRGASRTAR
ncbi:hypothetical protein [Streptomyces antimycoticus]